MRISNYVKTDFWRFDILVGTMTDIVIGSIQNIL